MVTEFNNKTQMASDQAEERCVMVNNHLTELTGELVPPREKEPLAARRKKIDFVSFAAACGTLVVSKL